MSDYYEGLEEGIKIGKEEAAARIAELERLLGRWLEADDEGDGHECIHAIAAARAALEGGKKDE